MNSARGLVVGKFWPPHRGHHAVIDRLTAEVDHVVVLVCSAEGQRPDGSDRALWIQAVHPTAEVVLTEDLCAWHHPSPCPDRCTQVWVERVADLCLQPIDVVATSESYGDAFARALGADHLVVDPDRREFPVSGTAVRSDLRSHWSDLHPVVRAGLFRRVVVLGAESTGTTTLASDLARAIDAPRTAEMGRLVSWERFARSGSMEAIHWTEDDFWRIVDGQIHLESAALLGAVDRLPERWGPWLVCDTDTLATVAWWERYLGTDSGPLLRLAGGRPPDLYVLTSPVDVPFDDSDPLRDGRSIRLGMHERLVTLVDGSGVPWIEVRGGRSERLESAVAALEEADRTKPLFAPGPAGRTGGAPRE